MGSLRGDVSVLGIANLLQALAFSGCDGLLTLELGTQPRVFFLHGGRVRLVRGSRRCQRLEKFLRSVGPGGSRHRAAPDREAIARLVSEWILDEIGELFSWLRGSFRFQEASELQAREQLREGPFSSFEPDGDLMTLLLEAARRVDEMARIRAVLPDLEGVPERTETALSDDDPPVDGDALHDVLPLVDGTRSVRAILQESVFPNFSVLHVMRQLVQRGMIRIRPVEAVTSAA